MNEGFCINGNVLPHGSENQILLVSRMVREHYFPGTDRNFPDWLLILSLIDVIKESPTASLENLFQAMTDPASIESPELRRHVHSTVAACRKHLGRNLLNTRVFRGGRQFSFGKLAAITAYFAAREPSLDCDKLNRLLFYSDFAHHWLYGESISGARYIRQWEGAGQEFFERNLDSLLASQILRSNGNGEHTLCSYSERVLNELSILEISTLHWAYSTYGPMSTPEIRHALRLESSHKFTRRGDYVAYEYSKLFKTLPPRPGA